MDGRHVLGTRLVVQDYRVAAAALLAVAGIAWALLLMPVLRHRKTPTTGISFVVGVAADGLAVLSATLAVAYRARYLVSVAVLFLLLGLAFYVFTVRRFDLGQLLSGQGDHWVAGHLRPRRRQGHRSRGRTGIASGRGERIPNRAVGKRT